LHGKFGGDHFSLTRLAMTQLHDPKFDKNFHALDQFYELCEKGNLPSYSFLEPVFGGDDQNDQHPSQDIRPGENLIAAIYNAVKRSPAFEETLLVITYDEHGGCYDHVNPPDGAKNPDPTNAPGQDGFRFNRFGIRVPCILINPYIPESLIARPDGYTPFDHTSVIKTVQNCLGLEPYLTERSNAAPDFSCVLLNDMPRVGKALPTVQPHDLKTNAKTQTKEPRPAEPTTELNELHRLIAAMICEIVDKQYPDDHNMLYFIQDHYNRVLGKNRKYTIKYKKRKGKWKKIKH
jgi:phospholipase C